MKLWRVRLSRVGKQSLEFIQQGLLSLGYLQTASLFTSIISSLLHRRSVRVTWNGELWEHAWGCEVFLLSAPIFNAPRKCSENQMLFTFDYVPQSGETIIDLGAGFGTDINYWCSLVGPAGKVIAVEPDPVAFKALEMMKSRMNYEQLILVNCAIDASGSSRALVQSSMDAVGNRLVPGEDRPNSVAVTTRTMGDLLDQLEVTAIDYVKVNVEGAESFVLQTYDPQKYRVRNWCISCHDFLDIPELATFEYVSRWLRVNNYRLLVHPPNKGKPWEQFYVYGMLTGPAS